MTGHLLWVDDDSGGPLQPLARILRRRGFSVTTTASYAAGMEALEKAVQSGNALTSLLVDVILPHQDGSGALSTDLGLKLAERAAGLGVTHASFLTVVPITEVADRYDMLVSKYSSVRWSYFSKTTLLDPGSIDLIADVLKSEIKA